MQMLARAGYAARGVVYAIVGYFAVLAAIGGTETKDTDDTLGVVLGGPFGTVLVGVLAIGLFGYALWRFLQATTDPDHFGTGAKGLAVRAGFLAGAVTYMGLAVSAAGAALGMALGGGGGGGMTEDLQREAVGLLGGRIVAAAVAAVFLGVAVAHAVRAVRCTYERFLSADADTRDRIRPVARFGLAARGAVFLVIGGLMAWRAWTATGTMEKPPTLKEVLETVQAMPFGVPLLAAMGLGLVAFALYSLIEAAYRRIEVRTPDIPGAGAIPRPRFG